MEEWKQELITAATVSEAFPAKERARYRQILEHLTEHSAAEQRSQRTLKILQEKFFSPDYGGNAATVLDRLEQNLERYYASDEGQQQTYRIVLQRGKGVDPANRYSVGFILSATGVLRAFWRPYLDPQLPTIIAYGIPLFVRTADQKRFTRVATLNVPSDLQSADPSEEICYPFVAHGDLLAAVELSRWLAAQHVPVKLAWFKAGDHLELLTRSTATTDNANVIALGSIRVNGILDDYQKLKLHGPRGAASQHLPFRLDIFDVVRLDEEECEVGSPLKEEHPKGMSIVPVVITRRAGAVRNRSAVTLIASNHGRAVARAARILTDPHELRDLLADDRLRGWAMNLPETFQLVLRVTVPTEEDGALDWVLEDAWASEDVG